MRRSTQVIWLVVALALIGLPAALADVPSPAGRASAWVPQAAGTTTTLNLQYGPYVIAPGQDTYRQDVEVVPADGFLVFLKPSAWLPDGSPLPNDQVHIHHAAWNVIGADGKTRWLFATGEERTEGDLERVAKADPAAYARGVRYGVPVYKGDTISFVTMPHNKTTGSYTIWVGGVFGFVYGSRDEIKQATSLDYRPLTTTLFGSNLQVPRTGGIYTWPRDLASAPAIPAGGSVIQPGVGHVWTAPWDGTIVVGSGHLHTGGLEVVVSNLGSDVEPCLDEGDGYAGKTIVRLREHTRNGVVPSDDHMMGLTKPGWRAKIRKGDRISINGVYDATHYGYRDQMSHFGFFADTEQKPAADEHCAVALVDDPGADQAEVTADMPSRAWDTPAEETCTRCEDAAAPLPPLGEHSTSIQIANFQYVPGDQATVGITGAPWVRRGEALTITDTDWRAAFIRHSVTSCRAPCNGKYVANYPNWDGGFDSRLLGRYVAAGGVLIYPGPGVNPATGTTGVAGPEARLDTSAFDAGYYSYYCRTHPWMRGSFYVVE